MKPSSIGLRLGNTGSRTLRQAYAYMHKEDYMTYRDYVGDEEDDKDTVDGLVAFNHELYNEQLVSIENADVQLDQLEEAMEGRVTSKFHRSGDENDSNSDESAESDVTSS